MYSLISFRISFPVFYHPPSMLSWSISYQNFALMIWRQIFSSLSRLYVQLWPCRPSFDMLTRSDLDHSCTIYYSGCGVALCGSLTRWFVAGHLLTNYFRPHYSGHFPRHLCWATRWICFKCKAFMSLSDPTLTITLSVWARGLYCRWCHDSP